MLGLAEERLGDDVELRVADLNGPLPFRAGAFGDVIASLVLSTGRRCPRGADWRPGRVASPDSPRPGCPGRWTSPSIGPPWFIWRSRRAPVPRPRCGGHGPARHRRRVSTSYAGGVTVPGRRGGGRPAPVRRAAAEGRPGASRVRARSTPEPCGSRMRGRSAAPRPHRPGMPRWPAPNTCTPASRRPERPVPAPGCRSGPRSVATSAPTPAHVRSCFPLARSSAASITASPVGVSVTRLNDRGGRRLRRIMWPRPPRPPTRSGS